MVRPAMTLLSAAIMSTAVQASPTLAVVSNGSAMAMARIMRRPLGK